MYQIEINLRIDPDGNSWTSHSQRFRYPTPYDTSAALRIVSKGSSWQSCFPHLPCSHPATRPECRLPSWSAPPKLLAVPLKHEAMNAKECTPEFDSIYSSYVLKLPGVCYFFGLSGLQIPWCGPFWDFTLSSAEMDTTVKRAVCGVEAGTTWFIFGLGNGRLSLSRKSPMLVLASKK